MSRLRFQSLTRARLSGNSSESFLVNRPTFCWFSRDTQQLARCSLARPSFNYIIRWFMMSAQDDWTKFVLALHTKTNECTQCSHHSCVCCTIVLTVSNEFSRMMESIYGQRTELASGGRQATRSCIVLRSLSGRNHCCARACANDKNES